ncbi:DUF2169 domain-containing protein [Sorangium sp. So ce429]
MQVFSACPLRVASRIWPTARGGWILTVVCKATYRLLPGESPLHLAQEPPHEQDIYQGDDPTRSLAVASDLAPFKPRADVVLVGSAHAAGGLPARSILARLIVGEVDKSIEVWCDRAWTQDGQLGEGARVTQMAMPYERAAGGPDSWNPVGVRHDAPPDPYGRVRLPNLQPPGLHISRRDDIIDPIGFGPIAPTWPWRRDRLGHHAGAWPHDRWWEQPLPEGFDPAFFNVAPRDQQIAELHENQRIVLENLHPEHPRLVTSLPGLRPRAIAERGSGGQEELALLCDTLWIDADRGLCALVWRGRLSLTNAEEVGRVAVTVERFSAPATSWTREAAAPESYAGQFPLSGARPPAASAPATSATAAAELIEAADEDADALRTHSAPRDAAANASPVLPFAASSRDSARSGAISAPPAPAAGSPRSRPTEAGRSAAHADTGTMSASLVPSGSPDVVAAPLPFSRSTDLPAPTAAATRSAPAVAPPSSLLPAASPTSGTPIAPPPLVTRPPQLEPIALPIASSPWSVADPGANPAQRASIGQLALARDPALVPASPPLPPPARAELPPAPLDEATVKRGWKPVAQGDVDGPASPSPPRLVQAALAGGGAASGAAAALAARLPSAEPSTPAPRLSAARSAPPEAIELLWYDPACVSRVRRQPGWKEIMAQVKPYPLDDDYPGEAPPERRQELRDQREVFGLLARAEPTDLRGIDAALANAVREDGTFVPPLVLAAGELEFPFDELETLKATIAAVMPFVSGDRRLKETVETTEQLLQTPWLKGASSVAEGLTQKIRDAFVQANRAVPPSYMETHTERMLLDQRAYQKRMILGQLRLRTLFLARGASKPIPVYLPSSVEGELPGFLRMTVRMVLEPRPRIEQFEEQPVAGRCLAIARVVSLRERA